MDVVDKGNYQIEVGLSKRDINQLIMGKPEDGLEERGILLGEQKIRIFALSEEGRDRMVPEEERMPATITYHRKVYHPEAVEERETKFMQNILIMVMLMYTCAN